MKVTIALTLKASRIRFDDIGVGRAFSTAIDYNSVTIHNTWIKLTMRDGVAVHLTHGALFSAPEAFKDTYLLLPIDSVTLQV